MGPLAFPSNGAKPTSWVNLKDGPQPPLHLAGHLAAKKNLDLIQQQLFWPGIKVQVQCYCALCPECQLHQAKGLQGGPLQPIPMVTVPFKWVGIDVVVLLMLSASKHHFLLVLVDYATHYPEAISLQNIHSVTVARELAQVFTRTGFPKEMVTDQEESFVSDTLQALWRYIGVQPLKTSMYHP